MRLPMSTKLIPIDTSFPEPEFTITMDQALAVADQNRWEILQAEYAYRAAKEQVKVAKSGYLPSVQVGGGYNWEDDDFPGFDHEGGVLPAVCPGLCGTAVPPMPKSSQLMLRCTLLKKPCSRYVKA